MVLNKTLLLVVLLQLFHHPISAEVIITSDTIHTNIDRLRDTIAEMLTSNENNVTAVRDYIRQDLSQSFSYTIQLITTEYMGVAATIKNAIDTAFEYGYDLSTCSNTYGIGLDHAAGAARAQLEMCRGRLSYPIESATLLAETYNYYYEADRQTLRLVKLYRQKLNECANDKCLSEIHGNVVGSLIEEPLKIKMQAMVVSGLLYEIKRMIANCAADSFREVAQAFGQIDGSFRACISGMIKLRTNS